MVPAFLLSPRLWAIASIAAVGFAGGIATHKLFTDSKIARLELRHAEAIAEWQSKVATAQAEARQREHALQVQVDTARTEAESAIRIAQELNDQIADTNRRLAAATAGAGRLRNQLAALSARREAEDTLSTCHNRVERLSSTLAECSVLLDEGLGLLAEGAELVRVSAKEADVRRAKLMACVRGWPQ